MIAVALLEFKSCVCVYKNNAFIFYWSPCFGRISFKLSRPYVRNLFVLSDIVGQVNKKDDFMLVTFWFKARWNHVLNTELLKHASIIMVLNESLSRKLSA